MSNQDSLDVVSIDKLSIDKRFHEGLCLAAGGHCEQGSAVFLDCVVADPGCGKYVEQFLANLRRHPPPTADKNVVPTTNAVQQAAAKGDWAQVLERGLHLLIEQPRNLQTLLALADACAAQGYSDSEACYA